MRAALARGIGLTRPDRREAIAFRLLQEWRQGVEPLLQRAVSRAEGRRESKLHCAKSLLGARGVPVSPWRTRATVGHHTAAAHPQDYTPVARPGAACRPRRGGRARCAM